MSRAAQILMNVKEVVMRYLPTSFQLLSASSSAAAFVTASSKQQDRQNLLQLKKRRESRRPSRELRCSMLTIWEMLRKEKVWKINMVITWPQRACLLHNSAKCNKFKLCHLLSSHSISTNNHPKITLKGTTIMVPHMAQTKSER